MKEYTSNYKGMKFHYTLGKGELSMETTNNGLTQKITINMAAARYVGMLKNGRPPQFKIFSIGSAAVAFMLAYEKYKQVQAGDDMNIARDLVLIMLGLIALLYAFIKYMPKMEYFIVSDQQNNAVRVVIGSEDERPEYEKFVEAVQKELAKY